MDQGRILIVDDDSSLRRVLMDQMHLFGYAIDEAADGFEAQQKLETGNYDVMLLDINLPGKTGIDVLRFIKDKSLKCRVIMLTGRVGFSVGQESMRLGADEYITKPFNIDDRLSSIRRVLTKKPVETTGGKTA